MEEFRESLKVNLNEKKEEKLTEEQAREIYKRYVAEQQEQFIAFINYLNQYLNKLKEQNEVLKNVQLRARIKATKSALKNYEIKALNDVFGIEFVCENEEGLKMLQNEMSRILNVTRIKVHNKKNGYKAVHYSYTMKQELVNKLNILLEQKGIKPVGWDLFPLIEIQYKTSNVFGEANLGKANYQKYKHVKKAQLKRIKQLYESGELAVGELIPYMWMSNSIDGKMKKLSTEEILRKMYPTLDITNNNNKNEIER